MTPIDFVRCRVEKTAEIILGSNRKQAFKWLIDSEQMIDKAILNGAWEPATTQAIAKLVRPRMTVVDAGANTGYYTVILSWLVGAAGHVWAFEPMTPPFSVLKAQYEMNDCTNVTARRQALGESPYKMSCLFNYSWPPERCTQSIEEIDVITLDSLGVAPRIDFIKIDLDGFEMKMLKGSKRVLEQDHPILLLEVCDYTLRATREAHGAREERGPKPDYVYGTEVRGMLSFLQGIGYRFLLEDTLAETDCESVLKSFDLSSRSINLVCV